MVPMGGGSVVPRANITVTSAQGARRDGVAAAIVTKARNITFLNMVGNVGAKFSILTYSSELYNTLYTLLPSQQVSTDLTELLT